MFSRSSYSRFYNGEGNENRLKKLSVLIQKGEKVIIERGFK